MTPQIGTPWRLKRRPDEFYLILAVTNVERGNPDYRKSVVFTDALGQIFSRVIDDWNESYEPIEDHFNFTEGLQLQACAVDVQYMMERSAEVFCRARIAAEQRRRQHGRA